MKPKNFPGRKLQRQLLAKRNRGILWTNEELQQIAQARQIRTKKSRRTTNL